jgi:OPA family glycerol-3-phosphate transporter-like MFS transporter
VAFGLFFLNIVRYGFMDWAPTYLFQEAHASISQAAYKAMAMPIAGSLGAIFVGWMSDKYFKQRRAPISAIMLFGLGLFAWLFHMTTGAYWVWSLLVLIMIGFLLYGPHVTMVATCPMDFGTRKAAASAAGFIDGFGYIGAAITGVTSGFLVDHFGWMAAFYLWIGGAVIAGMLMLLLWNYKPKNQEYH